MIIGDVSGDKVKEDSVDELEPCPTNCGCDGPDDSDDELSAAIVADLSDRLGELAEPGEDPFQTLDRILDEAVAARNDEADQEESDAEDEEFEAEVKAETLDGFSEFLEVLFSGIPDDGEIILRRTGQC